MGTISVGFRKGSRAAATPRPDLQVNPANPRRSPSFSLHAFQQTTQTKHPH